MIAPAQAGTPAAAHHQTAAKVDEGCDECPIPKLGITQSEVGESGQDVTIEKMEPNGPAAKAGLKTWDVLRYIDSTGTAYSGTAIRDPDHLNELLKSRASGDTIKFQFDRRGVDERLYTDVTIN